MNEIIVNGQVIPANDDSPYVVYRDHLYLYVSRLGLSPRTIKVSWTEAQLIATVVRQLEGCSCGGTHNEEVTGSYTAVSGKPVPVSGNGAGGE